MGIKEARELWINALLSGKYKQGIGRLKVEKDGEYYYCALGVACEVLKPMLDLIEESTPSSLGEGVTVFSFNQHMVTPPVSVLHALDLVYLNELIEMNDNRHFSFEQIVDTLKNMRAWD